jgi:serine/threonine-protein kinase
MAPILVGTVLDGKYRVDRVLGRGGMGMVLAAEHLQLGQRVALKVLLPEVCTNQDAVDRFLREARAAVRIQSEHVARVMDVGTLGTGEPYMVMEFLDGADLGQVLRARGPLPIADAIDYLLQACVAVAEAHALGIVHRDLKPANLFLTQRSDHSDLVKVLDFGISKALGAGLLAESASATASAIVMGSPQYMSPEQTISARDVDVRSDIWSLGIILHEMLTGTAMFTAESPTAVLIMISTVPATPLRSLLSNAPAELERALLCCLEKDRTKRYPNVAAFARAIGRFASDRGRPYVDRIARILGPEGTGTVAIDSTGRQLDALRPDTTGPWGHTQPATHRNRYRWVIVGVIAACALLSGALFLVLRSPAGTGAPASSATIDKAAAAPPAAEPGPPPTEPTRHAEEVAPPESPPPSEPIFVEPPPLRVEDPAARLPRVLPPPRSIAPQPKPKPAPTAPRQKRGKDLFDDPT